MARRSNPNGSNGNGHSSRRLGGRVKRSDKPTPLDHKFRNVLWDIKEKNEWTNRDMAGRITMYRRAVDPTVEPVKDMVIFDLLHKTQVTLGMLYEISQAFAIPLSDFFPDEEWSWKPTMDDEAAFIWDGLHSDQKNTVKFFMRAFQDENSRRLNASGSSIVIGKFDEPESEPEDEESAGLNTTVTDEKTPVAV